MTATKAFTFTAVVLATVTSITFVSPVSAQTNWEQRNPHVTPPARVLHVLVHDPARGRTVMFGGHSLASGDLNDTWEWDGAQWLERFPAHSPSPRHSAMACYDETRGSVILFGGSDTSSRSMGDTWQWDGVDWQLLATHGPSPRGWGGLAFDYANGWPILFSGINSASGPPLQDMWEFINGVWQQRWVQVLPPGSTAFIFCADPRRREIVFQGGSYNGGHINECWVWNGIVWTSMSNRGAYDKSSAAYDPIRRRVVAFGGGAQSESADTWEWDGSTWIRRWPSVSPSGRGGTRLAFDTVNGRMLLFGGGSGNRYSDETWEYFNLSPAGYDNYGQGCSGPSGRVPQLDSLDDSLPWIGESWSLELGNLPATFHVPFGLIGTSRTTANGLPLPFNLGVIGMPGCLMLMSGDLGADIIPIVQGRREWTFSIPLDQQLVGANVFLQALILNYGANDLGVIVSNGGDARLGMK